MGVTVYERSRSIRGGPERCGDHATMSVSFYLHSQPAVVAFHYEHGVDVNEVYAWNLEFVLEDELTVLSEEPWHVESTVELDGDRHVLVV